MQNEITDISEIESAIRLQFDKNPIAECILDEFICDKKYSDVDSLVTDLEMAHCAAGSFSGIIYTQDILDRLSDSEWRNAIEQAIEDYTDAVGESPSFDRDAMGYFSGFHLANLVTFAVDWVSNEIASFLRSNGTFYIVTQAVDSMDPSPERKVFLCEYEAQDYVSESLQHRMDYIVQHSPYAIDESEYESLEEQESELIRLEGESV
jgi:hypothetical protein